MDEFDRIKVIGKGSYGEVWLAKHKKDKKQVRTEMGGGGDRDLMTE